LKTLRKWTAAMRGLSPAGIAAILAVGIVLGTFPMYGCPTVLCLAAALVFRLNAAALEAVNQLTAPLQLALAAPYARLGARLLGSAAPVSHGWLGQFGHFTLRAAAGWLCVAVPAGIALYLVFTAIFVRVARARA
jgi:hypothetical protein